jgi:hypothetical protein
MTQAFNLSQLANNVNTSGLLNAAAGLYNQTPVPNGGTGVASVASGNLLVGAGTSAMTALAGAATNDVVTWNGTAWVSSASQGASQAPTLEAYTTPGTWTKPASVKAIKVTVVGGGGSTVTLTGGALARGSGGGGGGAAILIYPAPSLPGPQPYTVGTAGNTSSFGVSPAPAPLTVISATGGAAGGGGGANGGAGGIGSNGEMNIAGGGGGGSGNPNAAPGSGGSSIYGGGAAGRGTTGAGIAGGAYGGGASGASVSPATPAPQAGGTGATGVVVIEEFY